MLSGFGTSDLKQKGVSVRVGIEATGHAPWFERLMAGFELWIGDPAEIKVALPETRFIEPPQKDQPAYSISPVWLFLKASF
jgi:hypothetical protein